MLLDEGLERLQVPLPVILLRLGVEVVGVVAVVRVVEVRVVVVGQMVEKRKPSPSEEGGLWQEMVRGNGLWQEMVELDPVLDLLAVLVDDEGGEAVDPVAGAQLPGGLCTRSRRSRWISANMIWRSRRSRRSDLLALSSAVQSTWATVTPSVSGEGSGQGG